MLRCSLEQSFVQLGSRDESGEHQGAPRWRESSRGFGESGVSEKRVLNRPQQVMRRRVGGYDEQPVAGIERRPVRCEGRQDASKRPEIRRPHESRRAGCDH